MQTLLYRGYRILHVLYHALIGFNVGFVLALLLAQWTWLELRFNTGMLILFGCLLGAVYGLSRQVRRPLLVGSLAVLAVVCTSLAITQGDFEATLILIGVMFREGTFMPDLSLRVADLLTMGLGLSTVIVSFVYTNSQASRHDQD